MAYSGLSMFSVVDVLFAVFSMSLAMSTCPRHRGLPAGLTRADNRIEERALFWLDMREAINGYKPDQEYILRVQTTSKRHKFNDATITVDPIDKSCGHGRWVIDGPSLHSPQGCPDIVTTEQKHPMGRALFKWQAPRCGCLHFRVTVHADSLYYIEDANSTSGALAKTICVIPSAIEETSTTPSRVVTETTVTETIMSTDKRIQMLCKLNKKYEPKMVGTSGLQFGEQDHVDLLLQHLKHTTDLCCQQHGASNIRECFSDVRRRRIDQFCATGETAVPLTKPQQKWVSQKRSDCCLEIGEYRYECFDASAGSQGMLKDDQGLRQGGFRLDAFDPVNDLDYFEGAPLKIAKSSSSKEGQTATKVSNTASQFLVDGHAGRYLERDESPLDDSALPLAIEGLESSDVDNSNEEEHVSRADDKMKGQSRHRSRKDKGRCGATEQCCWKGIDAAFAGETQNIADCFAEADRRKQEEEHWDRACDRSFVICCLRVIDKLKPGQVRV